VSQPCPFREEVCGFEFIILEFWSVVGAEVEGGFAVCHFCACLWWEEGKLTKKKNGVEWNLAVGRVGRWNIRMDGRYRR